jgi:hypothetical protein
MSVIALVACCKTKRSSPCPAKDLYTSPLFTKTRVLAERHSDRWFILSAKYGLVSPDQLLAPYEQTLKDMSVLDRRAWASGVMKQMRNAGILDFGNEILWLPGNAYQQDLARLLANFPQRDPMKGMPIGKRLSWLKAAIDKPGSCQI